MRALGWFVVVTATTVMALSVVTAGPASPGGSSLFAWGRNDSGQLGVGNYASYYDTAQTVHIPPSDSVSDISGGTLHSLALLATGQVLAWGDNSDGQLGDGTNTSSNVPVQVELSPGNPLTGVTEIAAGQGVGHSLALLGTGNVMAWGDNTYGQLGDGTSGTSSNMPVLVCKVGYKGTLPCSPANALSGVKAISAGQFYSLALLKTDEVVAWGYNNGGELGNGTTATGGCLCNDLPVHVVDIAGGGSLMNVMQISAGLEDSLALLKNRQVVAWGPGNLGHGCQGNLCGSAVPEQVEKPGNPGPPLSGVTGIASGGVFSLVLLGSRNNVGLPTGTVMSWGYSGAGSLGAGDNIPTAVTPVVVCRPGFTGTPPCTRNTALSGVNEISAGNKTALALVNGQVLAWGENIYGEVGNGTTGGGGTCECVTLPVKVNVGGGSSTVTKISAGLQHGLAL